MEIYFLKENVFIEYLILGYDISLALHSMATLLGILAC